MKQRAVDVIQHSITTLKQYQNDIANLPCDTDGIYIISKGEARVQNAYDSHHTSLFKLAQGDYFGASKFLQD